MSSQDVDRREYLKWLGLSGAAGLAGCTSDGGDGGDGAGSTPADQSSSTDEETPTATDTASSMGGSLTVSEYSGPSSMNPIVDATEEGSVAARLTYAGLTWVNQDLEAQPYIATEWESNETADTWTFTLREDATFHHDGSSVLAEDFKATIEKVYDPDVGSPGEGFIGSLDSVEVLDDYRLEISTENPNSELARGLDFKYFGAMPKNVIEENWDELDSTDYGAGPFVVDEFEQDSRTVFTSYDDFFLTDSEGNSLPYLDEIVQQVIPEVNTAINSASQGSVDILRKVPGQNWSRVQNTDLTTLTHRSGRIFPIVMSHQTEPFDDNRVRQAFKYAIDQEEVLQAALNGLGYTAPNHTPVPPIVPGYAGKLEPDYGVKPKLEEARQLLADAGYADGLEIPMTLKVASERDPAVRPTAVTMQAQLAEAGIDFELEEITWDTYLSDIEAQYPFYIGSFGLFPITYNGLLIELGEGGAFNGVKWQNDEFNEALDDALAAQSPEARNEAYARAQQMVHEEAGFVVPYYKNVQSAHRGSVENYQLRPVPDRINVQPGVNITNQ
jgi:peptide/nickel transport system substrate-binding protein